MEDHEKNMKEEVKETMEEAHDEVQKVLDRAVEETDKAIYNAKQAYAENKDKLNLDKVKELGTTAAETLNRVFNDAMSKLNEMKNDPENQEKLNDAKEKLTNLYQTAVTKVKEGYDGLKNNEDLQQKLTDAGDKVKEMAGKGADALRKTYDDVMKDPKVADAADKVKDVADKGINAVKKTYDDVMKDPKVQKTVDQTKKGIVNAAEKAAESLKNWLTPDDENDSKE